VRRTVLFDIAERGGRTPPLSCFLLGALAFVATILAWPRAADAHPAVSAVAIIQVRDGGAVTITVYHDALAYALNDTPLRISDIDMFALLDAPEAEQAAMLQDSRERFAGSFRVWADERPLRADLTRAPDVPQLRQWLRDNPARQLPCRLDFVFKGTLPVGTKAMQVQFPAIMGEVVLSIDRIGVEPVYLPLTPGERSPEFDVSMATAAPRAPPAVSDAGAPAPTEAPGVEPPPTRPARDRFGTAGVAWRFVRLGFEHIIPAGTDHALFVLGLFLLTPRFKPVMWQISAFTVAHTITLTLTALHVVGLPSSVVEPAIAASIAFVGVENLVTRRVSPWRVVVAFIFGLVHGMGVATAFSEAGFPPGQLVTSLAAFTVGVEAGHMLVLAGAFIALAWARNKPWYRSRVAIPLSLVIGAIASYWFIERIL
jgi:hypothetical protein